jgi:hypothetical protein
MWRGSCVPIIRMATRVPLYLKVICSCCENEAEYENLPLSESSKLTTCCVVRELSEARGLALFLYCYCYYPCY